MKTYKVSVAKFGQVVVQAESKEEAAKKAEYFSENEICWITHEREPSGVYLVVLVEDV